MRLIKKKEIINPGYKVDFFSVLFSSGFYSGYFPVASGTFGSAVALLFFFIPSFSNIYMLSATIIISFIIGSLTSVQMVKRYGDDPSVVVIDEFVGMWITILISNFLSFGLINIVIGFIMFRFFDIVKLFPASYFDKIKNGFGIMMDDVVAGIYGGVSTYAILLLINYYK
jgi:phosphatidylglycerophosphatase A